MTDHAPSSPCPVCGRAGSGTVRPTDPGMAAVAPPVLEATYLCRDGHIWITKWAEVAA